MIADSGGPTSSGLELQRYDALLHMADLTAQRRDLPELFHEIAKRLQKVTDFSFLLFVLHDKAANVMRLHVAVGANVPLLPAEVDVENSASGWVWTHQRPLVIPDIRKENRFRTVFDPMQERGIVSYCMLPMTTANHQLGAIGLGTSTPDAYDNEEVQFLERVAEMVALAADNSLARQDLASQKDRLQALVEVNRTLAASLEMRQILPLISTCVARVVRHDFAGVTLLDPEKKGTRVYILASPSAGTVIEPGKTIPAEDTLAFHAITERKAKTFRRQELVALDSPVAQHVLEAGIRTVHCVPLVTPKGVLGSLNIGSKKDAAFSQQDHELLEQVAAQLAIALENARAYREIRELKDRLEMEKLYLEDEIRAEHDFEEIVGASSSLKRVLTQVKTVASSTASVLILGETGTGKELIARAIHRMSRRKEKSFIKLNCAAIPTGLLESELFGHEKGAFTGAISQKVGRLELAHEGTLFLDEIGDIPTELQPKLLRVLQDKEFERLGSTRTIRVDIRMVAATNRDLTKAVAEGTFRRDLYYRINVFPVRMPPLRERGEDIPLLVRHFIHKFAKRMDKDIQTIPTETMAAFRRWKWPGNVRELENFIERSVILTEGTVLRAPLAELHAQENQDAMESDSTLHVAEREHILRILREVRGVISGPRGAAARLGLKRTTLQYKMQKLGIQRDDYMQ